MARLNPYCSGRWSRTFIYYEAVSSFYQVLILIVVEDGLVHIIKNLIKDIPSVGLNPCCSGRWSRTI